MLHPSSTDKADSSADVETAAARMTRSGAVGGNADEGARGVLRCAGMWAISRTRQCTYRCSLRVGKERVSPARMGSWFVF